MFKYIILFTYLYSSQVFANQESVKCSEVLSGDAMICDFYKGGLKIVHIAGVDAPEKGQYGYKEAMAALSRLTNNKTLLISVLHSEESHVVARVYSNTDITSELLKTCWVYFRPEPKLSSVQNGYKIYEDQCRWKKAGVFKNGVLHYQRPEDFRKSGINELKQKYFNGTKDPKAHDLGRPNTDWRKK